MESEFHSPFLRDFDGAQNLNMMAALALINETITVITISLLLRFISFCRPEPQIARLYKERLGSQK